MVQVLRCNVLLHGILPQIRVKLEYILLGARKIKIGVDIKLGLLLLLDQRMRYLDFDLLGVL